MSRETPLKIFVASDSELINERRETIQVVHELRKVFPSLNLEAVEWETDIPPGSYDKQRIQDKINPLLEQCDVVLVFFYSKIGTFTLEEYRLAIAKNKKVFLYFKTGFSPKTKIENDNYGKVLEFREEIESENKLLYKEYQTLKDFKAALKDDLTLFLSQSYIQAEASGRSGGEGKESLTVRLYRGSNKYYDALRGPNGRFRYLNISDILLTGTKSHWLETPVSMSAPQESEITGETDPKIVTLLESLPLLWKQEVKHAVVVGEGGMGKTVSLLRWWEQLLVQEKQELPVPVFIALNEFNQAPEGERKDFIMASVLKNYGGDDHESFTTDEVKKTMKTPLTKNSEIIPSIVLLLDGFNEITVEKKELLLELNHLVEQCPGIQVVMTSRYDMRGNFNWSHWNLARLKELEDDKVAEYLKGREMIVPATKGLTTLIRNPMMLMLYGATREVQEKHTGSPYCCFKAKVETSGELLWNFIEMQVGNLPERLGQDIGQIYYYKFLLKYFLPALGFEMEKEGLFDFTEEQMDECIDWICRHLGQGDFLDMFREFEEHIDTLPLGKCANDIDRLKRRGKLKRIFSDVLHMIVKEGESYRFLHHNFRDFFAAVHLLNEVELEIRKKEIPGVLKERILDYYVRRFIGEIEGEHYNRPDLKDRVWRIDIKKNRLYRVLELCRGKYGIEVENTVWNIVTIWKEVRKELSGADLSWLDLTGVGLNEVRCSRFYRGGYLAAKFDGARVHEACVLPQGHTQPVNSGVYGPDGEKILSASYDNTIKEWDAGTGECVKTLTGHTNSVNSALYSPDGKKILSTSDDNTIKEWDATTGKCVKTLAGHSDDVYSAVYSRDGEKILSASRDNTIKEWDAATGKCVQTLTGHTHWVRSVVYSPDGEKILSASADNTIKEWDVVTGECVKTLSRHSSMVNSAVYSPDGEKILSASLDNTIKEWNAVRGECVKTLEEHTHSVTKAVYSPDGEKILSASLDRTIKEWDMETGRCLKTLTGHTECVTSAIYSPDGKKILSASIDKRVKEWDAETAECLKTLFVHDSIVPNAVYSRDGKKILTASWDNTIKEWDVESGKCVKIIVGHSSLVWSAVYSPDGEKILSASSDNTIKEWDAETGKCVNTLVGDARGFIKAIYSPDGKKSLSASFDHTIEEWDVETGKYLKPLYVPNRINTSHHHPHPPDEFVSDPFYQRWNELTEKCLNTKKVDAILNSIIIKNPSRKKMELIDIPGLFIQGCSFQNLEKGSEWSEGGLTILKQYHAIV